MQLIGNPLLENYLRDDWTWENMMIRPTFSWAIPDEKAIQLISKYSPIIEIGAGRGYWAKLISETGADILAFDLFPPNKEARNFFHHAPGLYFPVAKGGAATVKKHPNRTLFLCWPPYDTPMALQTVKAFKGTHVIYIGEGSGGCTGCDKFHSYLEKHFDEVETYSIPQWFGIHDYMSVHKRKCD